MMMTMVSSATISRCFLFDLHLHFMVISFEFHVQAWACMSVCVCALEMANRRAKVFKFFNYYCYCRFFDVKEVHFSANRQLKHTQWKKKERKKRVAHWQELKAHQMCDCMMTSFACSFLFVLVKEKENTTRREKRNNPIYSVCIRRVYRCVCVRVFYKTCACNRMTIRHCHLWFAVLFRCCCQVRKHETLIYTHTTQIQWNQA